MENIYESAVRLQSSGGSTFLFLCPLGLATTTVVIYYIKVKFRGL